MKTIIGNILDIQTGLVLHQVNCRGVLGGLAAALEEKWPEQFIDYARACRRVTIPLGTTLVCDGSQGPHIGHVFGQLEPGPNTDMKAVAGALGSLLGQVMMRPDRRLLAVYAPYRMGCGIGGGIWPQYLTMLETCFPEITIVQRPEDAR